VNNIREVPQAARKSVVTSMIATIIINVVVTVGFYTT
jgi:ABC-type transporter Mla maintaining outer membrane lipid asymmetry permease subunit MlaE